MQYEFLDNARALECMGVYLVFFVLQLLPLIGHQGYVSDMLLFQAQCIVPVDNILPPPCIAPTPPPENVFHNGYIFYDNKYFLITKITEKEFSSIIFIYLLIYLYIYSFIHSFPHSVSYLRHNQLQRLLSSELVTFLVYTGERLAKAIDRGTL